MYEVYTSLSQKIFLMPKKILIAAGGTGGHLYPAIGLAKQLIKEDPTIDVLFAAGGLGANRFFSTSGLTCQTIEAAGFTKKSLVQCFKSGKAIFKGVLQSRRILSDFSPNVVVGFGSYHSFPLLLAAQLGNYPILLHEQNSKPGKVVRFFSKKALFTGVYFPSAKKSLRGKAIELAMPLREGYSLCHDLNSEAISYFGLEPSKTTLLVFGGSQGARVLNEKISLSLSLQKNKLFQVLHFTGDSSSAKTLTQFYKQHGIQAVVKDFEQRMNMAWAAADLAITRAGAGTIAEQLEFEVPAVLVPYPYASENHQDSNADYLVDTVGGGWKYPEAELDSKKFSCFLSSILKKNNSELEKTKQKLSFRKTKACRQEFSGIIHKLLESL